MQVTLTKQQIQEIATAANMIIGRNSAVPVLEHLHFAVTGHGELMVTMTDLEQVLSLRMSPVEQTGEPVPFLVPLAELKALKSAGKTGGVTFAPDGEDSLSLTIASDAHRVKRTVATLPVGEFPWSAPQVELKPFDLGAFVTGFRNAAFAVSTDAARLVMNGVYYDPKRQALAATDGKRLTVQPLQQLPLGEDIIIPATKTLLRLLPESGQGRIGVYATRENQTLVIENAQLTYACRCLDGVFPNYVQVIPSEISAYTSSFALSPVDRQTLAALQAYLDRDHNHAVALFGNGAKIAIGLEGEAYGTMAVLLAGSEFSGESTLAFTVDGKLLLDALKHGFCTIRVSDARSPLLLNDNCNGVHLLMPLFNQPSDALRAAVEAEFAKHSQTVTVTPPTTMEEEPTMQNPTPQLSSVPAEANAADVQVTQLQMVENDDPVAALDALLDGVQDSLKQAHTAMREIKKQARALKAHYRQRDKVMGSREKELEKSLTLISRLQESIAA